MLTHDDKTFGLCECYILQLVSGNTTYKMYFLSLLSSKLSLLQHMLAHFFLKTQGNEPPMPILYDVSC